MNTTQILRVKELFLGACELPAEQRAGWLDQQGETAGPVRDKVLRQLALFEDDRIGVPIARPRPQSLEDLPDQIGPYRVLERIGEGGMGVVFRGTQAAPLERTVAVKRIKPGMDSRAVLARFEAERRVLARLEHPNIARVLDAGADAAGRPWFAMEWVDGVTITDYCDQREFGAEPRLRLFLDVCRGVEHAHQRSILHRDLKPANVLVTEVDGRPVPKIIDFGVAKAIQPGLDGRSLQTQLGLLIGTPEYMSPEQADPGEVVADTRSDVYSLGVLLYELLSGQLPFEPARLQAAGWAGIARLLRDEEPPRPSTRLSAISAAVTTHARRRSSNPRRLALRLRGDLDWITMRALRKQPQDRYASPGALAADLERHLSGQPVEAGPPTWRYRCAKFVRRHRAQAAALFLAVVGLLAGTFAALWSARNAGREAERARTAQAAAEQSAAAAEAERDAARQLISVFTGALEVLDPDSAPDGAGEIPALLEQTADLARTRLRNRPQIEAELLLTIGRAASTRGDLERSASWLRRAYELRAADPTSTPGQLHEVLWPYSWAIWYTGGLAMAGAWRRAVVEARHAACDGCPELDRPLRELRSWVDPFYTFELADPPATIARIRDLAETHYEAADPRWVALADYLVACMDRAVVKRLPTVDSERLFDLAIAMYRAGADLDTTHTRHAQALELLLQGWFGAGEVQKGRQAAQRAVDALARSLPDEHWQLAHFRAWIAYADLLEGRGSDRAAAGVRLRTAIDHLLETVGARCRATMPPLAGLIEWLRESGDTNGIERYRAALTSAMRRMPPDDLGWAVLAVDGGTSSLGDSLRDLRRKARLAAAPKDVAPLFEAIVDSAEAPEDVDMDRRMAIVQALISCYDKVQRKPFVAEFPGTARRVLDHCMETWREAGPGYYCYARFYLAELLLPTDPEAAAELLSADVVERQERFGDFYFTELNRFQIARAAAERGAAPSALARVRQRLRRLESRFGILDYNSRPVFTQALQLHQTAEQQLEFARHALWTLDEALRGGVPAAMLAERSWAVARSPGLAREDYDSALKAAREAVALDGTASCLFALGVAQLRVGQSAAAVRTLEEVRDLHGELSAATRGRNTLFLALALHGLGASDRARNQLREARELLGENGPSVTEETWLTEAADRIDAR